MFSIEIIPDIADAPPKIADVYSDSEINALIAYVEGGCTDCDEEYGIVCTPCVRLAECVGGILREHGYPCTYAMGELDPEGREHAERLYLRYCAESGLTPIGITA